MIAFLLKICYNTNAYSKKVGIPPFSVREIERMFRVQVCLLLFFWVDKDVGLYYTLIEHLFA